MSDPSAVLPSALLSARPEPDEYAPYHGRYISLIQGNDIISTLESQRRQMMLLLCGRDQADGDLRYAPGKWTVKQVLGHVCDEQRVGDVVGGAAEDADEHRQAGGEARLAPGRDGAALGREMLRAPHREAHQCVAVPVERAEAPGGAGRRFDDCDDASDETLGADRIVGA